jgi:glycosyltransferase involved in cell wall biosynthesis
MVGEHETGNETYTVNLLRGLAATGGHDLIQVLTPHPDVVRAAVDLPPHFRLVPMAATPSWWRIPVAMPLAVRQQRAQVLHVSYVAPPFAGCPTVVTVHDLSYLVYPGSVTPRVRLILSTLVPLSVRRAARVIAVSSNTKRDLVERYRLPPEKVSVVFEAAAPAFKRLDATPTRSLPAGVREPFLLAVGNVEPRKNLDRLVEAFKALRDAGDFPGQLVLAGKQSARAAPVLEKINRLGLSDAVVFTGYLGESDLNLLYNRAALFIYPSLYEGFGLPPLEAMACGCPVVASNTSSIPEVLGDAALLVDPTSTTAITDAMRAVLSRPEVAAQLRERGSRRAAMFSWERAAMETRQVYAQAVGERQPAGAA